MTQRKRTPHKGQQAAKAGRASSVSDAQRPSSPPDAEPGRETVEIDVVLDEPLLSLPPPAREKMQTLTDESELERARLRSIQMSSFPPERPSAPPVMEPILSMANRIAPSNPPQFEPEPPDLPTAPPPPDAMKAMERERNGDPVVEMRDRHALGDYTGALQIAEEILLEHPTNAAALACAESCREVLVKMYTARIGQLDKVPVVMIARNQLRWLSLDHRAGFVLSHIDGVSSVEMILDVSGMATLDCLRILTELVQQRVISFR